MSSIVKFTCTKMQAKGKEGILKPDGQGYFEVVVGGLNTFNSSGQYYALEGAKELFESSSVFMRRVERGALRGEVGHPIFESTMSNDDWVNRVFEIRESNVCCHFKEIWLDYDNVKGPSGEKIVAVIAKVIPSGKNAEALERAISNPNENLAFSVRGITEDSYQNGKTIRVLKNIITYDWVGEPGIAVAERWHSPALETIEEKVLSIKDIEKVSNKRFKLGLAKENSSVIMTETLDLIKPRMTSSKEPKYIQW